MSARGGEGGEGGEEQESGVRGPAEGERERARARARAGHTRKSDAIEGGEKGGIALATCARAPGRDYGRRSHAPALLRPSSFLEDWKRTDAAPARCGRGDGKTHDEGRRESGIGVGWCTALSRGGACACAAGPATHHHRLACADDGGGARRGADQTGHRGACVGRAREMWGGREAKTKTLFLFVSRRSMDRVRASVAERIKSVDASHDMAVRACVRRGPLIPDRAKRGDVPPSARKNSHPFPHLPLPRSTSSGCGPWRCVSRVKSESLCASTQRVSAIPR
jgi:hypothetical protein